MVAQLERRIKAAQALAGFDSVDDMAEKIGRESLGLSRKTLRRIVSETDPRRAKDYELEWIAEACGVPVRFFTDPDPFAAREAMTDDRIAREVQFNREMLMAAVQQSHEERRAILGLLKTQEGILQRMEAAAGLLTDENVRALNEAARRLEGLG